MPESEKKKNNLLGMLEVLTQDFVTEEDFRLAVDKVVETVKNSKFANDKAVEQFEKMAKKKMDEVERSLEKRAKEIKEEAEKLSTDSAQWRAQQEDRITAAVKETDLMHLDFVADVEKRLSAWQEEMDDFVVSMADVAGLEEAIDEKLRFIEVPVERVIGLEELFDERLAGLSAKGGPRFRSSGQRIKVKEDNVFTTDSGVHFLNFTGSGVSTSFDGNGQVTITISGGGGSGDATSLQGVDLDATVGSPSDGDILVYRSAGNDWVLEAKPAGGSNPALNDVTDVTITTVADNEVLAYDSGTSEWINQTAAEASLATAAQGALADSALQDVVDDTTPQLGGALDGQGFDLNNLGVVFLTEQASAEADVAGKGQFWVKDDTPNTPMFTGDDGLDRRLRTTYTLEVSADVSPAILDATYFVNASAADRTISLPDTSADNDGHIVRIVSIDATNDVIITTVSGTDTVGASGTTQRIKEVDKSIMLVSDFSSTTWRTLQDSRALANFLSGSTYETLQEQIDLSSGFGTVSGGVVTDGGSGTVDVSGGQAQTRTAASSTSPKVMFDFSAATGVALTDASTNFVYLDYNGGSPTIAATSNPATITGDDSLVVLGVVYRDGTNVYISDFTMFSQNHVNKINQRMFFVDGLTRQSGLVTTETGTRNLAITSGVIWLAFDRYNVSAFDSSVSDTWSYWYRDGASGWTEVASSTAIDNTQYDDDSGTLATLSNNKYGVHWVYTAVDGTIYVVYGQGDYNLQEAQDAQIPAELPPFIQVYHTYLVAKVIIQKNASTFTEIQLPFETTFQAGTASSHTDLANLAWTTSGHTGTASRLAGFNGSGAAAEYEIGVDVQAYDADLDTWATLTPSANAQSLVTAANYAAMRALLDLEAGTDFYSISAADAAFQPLDAELSAIAGLTSAADTAPYFTGSGTAALMTVTSAARSILDDTSTANIRTTLGLGTGNSPQFTAVNIGNATDTTIARVSAGQISVEGVQVVTLSNTVTLTNKDISSSTNTYRAASTTVSGASELATTAEVDTGTDTTRTVTPDALAGSYAGTKSVTIQVFEQATDVATGDAAAYLGEIPEDVAGMNLVGVKARVITAGTTGTTDIQIHNVTQAADMLSTKLTIDSAETSSSTAATAAVIDTANDDVAENDLIRIDVDAVSTTAPQGLFVTLTFRLP